jgi:hypothetical protein
MAARKAHGLRIEAHEEPVAESISTTDTKLVKRQTDGGPRVRLADEGRGTRGSSGMSNERGVSDDAIEQDASCSAGETSDVRARQTRQLKSSVAGTDSRSAAKAEWVRADVMHASRWTTCECWNTAIEPTYACATRTSVARHVPNRVRNQAICTGISLLSMGCASIRG